MKFKYAGMWWSYYYSPYIINDTTAPRFAFFSSREIIHRNFWFKFLCCCCLRRILISFSLSRETLEQNVWADRTFFIFSRTTSVNVGSINFGGGVCSGVWCFGFVNILRFFLISTHHPKNFEPLTSDFRVVNTSCILFVCYFIESFVLGTVSLEYLCCVYIIYPCVIYSHHSHTLLFSTIPSLRLTFRNRVLYNLSKLDSSSSSTSITRNKPQSFHNGRSSTQRPQPQQQQ